MNIYTIRATHVDGKTIPVQEIEAEWPSEALDIYADWLVEEYGFDLRRLQCINIDLMQPVTLA